MNLSEYLRNKEERKELERSSFSKFRKKCFKCFRPKKACFCDELKTIKTQSSFKILMHPKEAKKESITTGRLSRVVLEDCEIITDSTFNKNQRVQELLGDKKRNVFLLYPGKNSLNLDEESFVPNMDKKNTFFILDGTWPCVKSMMRDSSILHALPRVSFSSKVSSRFSIKHQPASYCLSTIESIYYLLEGLEKQQVEKSLKNKEELLYALERLVNFQLECANNPDLQSYKRMKKPYKAPKDRKDNKKWLKRRVIYEKG